MQRKQNIPARMLVHSVFNVHYTLIRFLGRMTLTGNVTFIIHEVRVQHKVHFQQGTSNIVFHQRSCVSCYIEQISGITWNHQLIVW